MDRDGNVVGGGGGSAVVLHTLCFRLESPAARAVASFAPELVVLRARGGEGWLTHVGRALGELSSSSASSPSSSDARGVSSVKRRLAEIVFTTALRDALALGGVAGPHDRAVAAAVLLVHAEPAHPWTASRLARRVGLSRSSFCVRFAEAMGCGPARHVQRVRMEHAAYLLAHEAHGPSSIEATARKVGYASASAFSVAFRRWHGSSPARFARARNPDPGSRVS